MYISGFVQGVGYRQFVRRNAQELGLVGWIKNLPGEGQGGRGQKVEAVFQGEKAKIDQMVLLCRKGPFLSEVKNVEIFWEESIEVYTDFVVVFS